MKRSLLILTSAVALGAIAGFVISDLNKLSPQLPPVVTAVISGAPATAPASKAKVASKTTAFGRLIDSTVALVSPRANKPLPVGSLVLNEPVVMVQGGDRPYTTIPQGTAVSLVKNEGRFMSVRHNQNVLTVPRSAVAVGVVRSN